MKVRRFAMSPYEERAYCDHCGGELIKTDVTYTSNPPQYPYRCAQCAKVEVITEVYPRIVWREVGEIRT